ncbi:hypothetical protein JHK87_049743 [Glycine soja]|nr:hypothetical protein JHK87_049743 [Glycine soja]
MGKEYYWPKEQTQNSLTTTLDQGRSFQNVVIFNRMSKDELVAGGVGSREPGAEEGVMNGVVRVEVEEGGGRDWGRRRGLHNRNLQRREENRVVVAGYKQAGEGTLYEKEIVSLLKDDSTFIQELFARLKLPTTSQESKKNLVSRLLSSVL